MVSFLRIALVVGTGWTLALTEAATECNVPSSIRCSRNTTTITLDADLTEWTGVAGISTPLQQPYSGPTYAGGAASYKCLYSDTHLYLTMEIPGTFRFDATSNEKCAAVSTMFKIGEKATFVNMGGCPLALSNQSVCDNLMIPDACEDYRVDLGSHWELSATTQGVEYGINLVNGTGGDVFDKNDEYSVAPTCRLLDDGAGAGNEWAGAWAHTQPSDGSNGTYIFELSRLLTTASAQTDAQLQIGNTYSFGVAFWDPWETEDGWSDPGHYVSGCGSQFMDLVLGGDAKPVAAPVSSPVQSGGVSRGEMVWWWMLGAAYWLWCVA